jgi:hypothetical protein
LLDPFDHCRRIKNTQAITRNMLEYENVSADFVAAYFVLMHGIRAVYDILLIAKPWCYWYKGSLPVPVDDELGGKES